MKLVLFDDDKTGLLRDGRVVDLSPALGDLAAQPAQWRMEAVIEGFDEHRPQFERLAESERGVPADSVQMRAPLPRPRHLLCAFSNYLDREGTQRGNIDFFLQGRDEHRRNRHNGRGARPGRRDGLPAGA